MANIRAITNKYVPQYVGNVNEEVGTLLKDYQTKQTTVLNAANELDDSFGIAASQLDETDRKGFEQYTKGIKDSLKGYTDEEYVGNLDRKIVHQGNQFKNIYGVFKDNTARKRKFVEDITKSGLSEDEQQRYLTLANKKNGSLQYDPINGSVANRFNPIEVIKNPDANKMLSLIEGIIPVDKGIEYVSPDLKQVSKVPRPDLGFLERSYERKIINNDTVGKISSKLTNDPEYQQYYQRQLELGGGGEKGKEYANAKHNQILKSITSGLQLGEKNNESIKLDDIVSHNMKKKADVEKDAEEEKLVGKLTLGTPMNKKMFNADHIADMNSLSIEANEKGDTQRGKDIAGYTKRIEDKYGIKYGKDYEQISILGVKKLRILNDSKKHLVEQANADIQKDAMNTTTEYPHFSFSKKSSNEIMSSNFQQSMGNLTQKNTFATDKHNALYTPMDANTNEPLTIKQMSKLKNAQFMNISTTPNGLYFTGRSNGSSKEQEEGSTDSDFTFNMKVPNEGKVLDVLVQLGEMSSGKKNAYMKLQGVDDNYGNYKQIDVRGNKVLVKKVLPSEGGSGYIAKHSKGVEKFNTFSDLVEFLGNAEDK